MNTAANRLLNNSTPGDDGCRLWTGHTDTTNGYGRLTINGRTVGAHRLAYETWVGAIPSGMHIDHLCRVRSCIAPAHLEAVTQAENNRRAWAVHFAGQMHSCGHPRTRGGACPICREAKLAERAKRQAAKRPPTPKASETGVRVCGHPYLAPGDCPQCARERAARYREQMRAGEVQAQLITCAECGREQPKCAKGLCRRCYTRLYKRATYVPPTRRASARVHPRGH